MYQKQTARGSLQEVCLNSRYLNSAERLVVYTPPSYSPLYSYPVIYIQDGEDYLSMGRCASQLDQFFAERGHEEAIAVFLPVEKRLRQARYYPEGAAYAGYKRFVADEVVPYIDSHFATNPLAYGRTLLGESLGGVVSLFLAFTYPHTFGQIACQSAAVDERLLDQLAALPGRYPLSVYLEVGKEETAVATQRGSLNLLKANDQLAAVLSGLGCDVSLHHFAGGHDWGAWQANLSRIFRHFLG
ncbi:alpha/beta hydrolase [Brevibacillus fulvus]|uniref:Enterochelin esterase-like enzyme n=1 Tax=Brevibacillus fulvus TaxID=1125967 RepID=A0A938Y2T0_9BACL|nr:alpha/beta hydrolase-fold protein [Brevibacillus fulvus]MBM7590931.1 enterochelin esterase-like enzyme [Brevibacillus fulvus]